MVYCLKIMLHRLKICTNVKMEDKMARKTLAKNNYLT